MEHLRKPLDLMAMKLLQAAKELYPNDNVVICPFTVTSVITMLYYASSESSGGAQIERLLRYSDLFDGRSDPKAVLMAFREATRILTKVSKQAEAEETAAVHEFRMVLANRVFIQRNSNISPEFLEVVQKNLKIEFEHLNFDDDAKDSESKIETWLKDRIRIAHGGLPPGTIDTKYHGPRMVIASAAHFRASWEVPFDKRLTGPAPFFTQQGKYKQVEMMHLTDKFPYYEDSDKGYKMLELPYFRNGVTVILTLPLKRGGLDELMKELTHDAFTTYQMRKRMKMVKVSLPKFRFHSTYNLKALLHQVGIREIFQDSTPMAKMTTDATFRISEGIHKCAIQIDEDGSFVIEDATAETNHNVGRDTAVATPPSSLTGKKTEKPHPGIEEFTADSPFLLGLRHNRTGVFLFSGRVMLP